MKVEEIITDDEVDNIHGHANFGSTSKRGVIAFSLLKYACGFYTGSTARRIVTDHRLITPKGKKLTKKGREYLWAVFGRTRLKK